MLEPAEPKLWLDLTFGLLPGWWRFEDEYRVEHALAEPSVWERALGDAGFGDVTILSSDAAGDRVVAETQGRNAFPEVLRGR